MKPAPFDYHQAKSSATAIGSLSDFDGYAVVLAGGQTLVPLLNLRLVQPDRVVDISSIESLTFCREESHAVVLGAGCSHAALEDTRFPDPTNGLLAQVAGGIAYRSIRNRGTLGGSLAYADPAAEWPVVMHALGAELQIEGPQGVHTVPANEFLIGPMSTTLAPDELLVAVRIPVLPRQTRWGFGKLSRKPGDFAQALAVVILGKPVTVVIGATTQGVVALSRVADYISALEEFRPHHLSDLAAVFLEDLTAAGIELDPYQEQTHRHTLAGVITDAFNR